MAYDDNDRSNSMQANLGLLPGSSGPYQMATPSPGETSLRLMQQSQMSLEPMRIAGQQSSAPMAAASVFQFQFQRQFQQIQQQQSMSPYMAQAYAQNMPWTQQYQGGMLPSPLTMTPPSTGIFRPPPMPTMAPIPPAYTPPMYSTPFTPQQTAPMFQTPYDQTARNMQVNQDRMFAMASQAPNWVGQAAAYGGSALLGSQIGGAIGGTWGRAFGALGGAALAGASGFASGVGSMAQMPFQPNINQAQMGASIQRMSQDWVISGGQLDPSGRGLGRSAGMDLARGFTEMAGSRGFQQETGGMFNRNDLMKMTSLSGQSGMLDMSQSVPAIQGKMREIARNVREFMQLTNDPDVTNVIREMGRMQQFGLTGNQITQAAQNMRAFSRAAGTSIQGLQQMGGIPGAATFQSVGLSAGQGFEYGNYSAALARQSVAAGTYTPMQLSMLGGVQGLTQRNTQAQAAMMSMPLMGAAFAQYGQGGWGLNQAATMGGGLQGGAAGMINQARMALNQGIQQGGVGALAMFPLQQRQIQSEAMAAMSPYEQTAMRFRSAMQTGRQFGLKGEAAFAGGARMLYGDEVAEQMMMEAKNPAIWGAQRDMIEQQRNEAAFRMRSEDQRNARGMFADVTEPVGRGLGKAGSALRGIGQSIGEGARAVGDWWEDRQARASGVVIKRRSRDLIASSAEEDRALDAYGGKVGGAFGYLGTSRADLDFSTGLIGEANRQVSPTGERISATVGGVSQTILAGATGGIAGLAWGGVQAAGLDPVGGLTDAVTAANLDSQEELDLVRGAVRSWKTTRQALKTRNATGKASQKLADNATKVMMDKLPQYKGLSGGNSELQSLTRLASEGLVQAIKYRTSFVGKLDFSIGGVDKALIDEYAASTMSRKEWSKLNESEKNSIRQTVVNQARILGGNAVAEPLNELDAKAATNLSRTSEEALSQMREAVQQKIEDTGTKLDFTSNIGFWDLGDAAGKDKIDSMLRETVKGGGFKYSELEMAGMARAARVQKGTTSKESDAELKQLWEKNKGKSKETYEQFLLRTAGTATTLDEDVLTRLGNIGSEQDKGSYKNLMDYAGAGRKLRGQEKFITGLAQFEQYGFGLTDMLLKSKGKGVNAYDDINVDSVLAGMSEDTLKQMETSGQKDAQAAAMLAREAKGGGKGAAAAKEKLRKHILRSGTVKEKTVTAGASLGGSKEEQDLNRAANATSEMQQMFADFGPAVQDFSAGAKLLRDAMEQGWAVKNQE